MFCTLILKQVQYWHVHVYRYIVHTCINLINVFYPKVLSSAQYCRASWWYTVPVHAAPDSWSRWQGGTSTLIQVHSTATTHYGGREQTGKLITVNSSLLRTCTSWSSLYVYMYLYYTITITSWSSIYSVYRLIH